MDTGIFAKDDTGVFANLFSRIFRIIYWPICRGYARRTMPKDEPANRIMKFLVALPFWVVHGYWPRSRYPRIFSENNFIAYFILQSPYLKERQ